VASLAGLAPADIVPPAATPGPRADSTVWLTHTWRFDPTSRIGQLARRIVSGDTQDLAEWLAQGERGSEVYWLRDTPDQRDAVAEAALEGYAEYLRCIRQGERDPRRLREVFDRFRVLCAVRDGRTGTRALNRLIAAQVAAAAHAAGEGGASAWTTGRAVMVLRNDPALRLFNGDIGLVARNADGQPRVYFPTEAGGLRDIAPARLPEHETAFAMTVHKAQGSEFDRVLVVLPGAGSPVLSRELVYTAVTRARRGVVLAAGDVAIDAGGTRVCGDRLRRWLRQMRTFTLS
jgi:exodeoxyribonuclease V alpha subunit